MAKGAARIEHFVVLMLENRSFDNLLGYYAKKTGLDVLTGAETNPVDPNPGPGDPPRPAVPVSPTATDATLATKPAVTLEGTNVQMYGRWQPTFPNGGLNNGFVYDYAKHGPGDAGDIMRCFPNDARETRNLRSLVDNYCVCDKWFASAPAPTWPNRLFVHAATSGGHVANDVMLYRLPSIYDRLDARFGKADDAWAIYYHDIPQSIVIWALLLDYLLPIFHKRFRAIDRFRSDVANGRLARYTFIEPQYFDWAVSQTEVSEANSQHPSKKVSLGDRLIGDVYESLSGSRYWDTTMLIVTWDEHGGTYDHRFPEEPTVSPDDKTSQPDHFAFTRLGLRVPAVIVSPWVTQPIDSRLHDHTAILAAVEKRFDLEPLTARDAWAAGHDLLTLVGNKKVAPLPAFSRAPAPPRRPDRDAVARVRASAMSDFQESLVELARHLDIPGETLAARGRRRTRGIRTEHEGAQFVRETMGKISEAAKGSRRPRQ
jgi:phospholipase C